MTDQPDFRALCSAMSSWWGVLRLPAEATPEHVAQFEHLGDQARAALNTPPPERGHWSEGVCGDGAAILLDGVMQPIEAVVAALNTPPLAPIPVFERLPGAEDLKNGYCWFWSPVDECWFWERPDSNFVRRYGEDFLRLPHWAIPLPEES